MKSSEKDSSNGIVSSNIREAFNKIKINIDFIAVDKEAKVLIVTSSMMAEGKTTIAINTAISMAVAGGRTLLIDSDMRQPRVHRMFGITNLYGLSDVVARNMNWHEVVNDVGIPNLNVLTSGRKPPNPAELLGSNHMMNLIGELREHYDYILFDAPPILPVPDAVALSKYTDGILLTVRYGYSNYKALQQCNDALKIANAKIIGAVVNDVPMSEQGYGYGSNYGYGYGYGYGVESNDSDEETIEKKSSAKTTKPKNMATRKNASASRGRR